MSDVTESGKVRMLTLFVCSGCEACDQAMIFLQGWAKGCSRVKLEIVTIEQQPERIVRFGITNTPALALNGEVLAQNLSIDTLAEVLKTSQSELEAGSPSARER